MYVIATGSSSFELAGQVGEPLTGRKHTLTLYPLAQAELLSLYNRFDLRQQLEDYLLFGTYPDAVLAKTRSAKIEVVEEIAGSYLLKDILAFDRVRSSKKLSDLVRLLAFQIGGEVSYNELATQLALNVRTVQHYLDLLEKSFVVFRLGGLSRNLWVEERGEQLRALEFKWTRPNKLAAPKAWQSTYPGSAYAVITPADYQDLILPR